MKRYLGIPFCILLTVFLCLPAHSQEQPKSLASIQAAALAGDPEAQFQLGYKYATGDGVVKDPQLAARWYMAAASRGHIIAAHNLGCCYITGLGISKNRKEAFKWFKIAAEKGHLKSIIGIGYDYMNGICVNADPTESLKWFTKAANMGSPEAQYILALLYSDSKRGVKNPERSFKWCKKSAENDFLPAQSELGRKYETGDGVYKNPTAALFWIQQAAAKGDAYSELMLGSKYQTGTDGLEKDYQQAMKYYRLSAEQGNSMAQFMIGSLYSTGLGVPKDYIEALAWINVAAASDNSIYAPTRDKIEKVQGFAIALAAQKRSKEILASFPSKKVQSNESAVNSAPVEVLNRTGSGVMISPNGDILTAAHVVSNASHIEVMTSQGRKTARILQIDKSNDIAMIKCEGLFEPIPIASSKGVKLGQTIFSIGFPNIEIQGTSPKMTKGEISSLYGYQDDPRLWQISVPIQPGNSGGPLCDEAGNLIGIVVSKLNAVQMAKATGDVAENVGYAIKSAYIAPLLDNLGINQPQFNRSARNANLVDQVDQVSKSVVMILAYSRK